ncbi:MAG: phosphatase PAP2 family protein [Pseudonocardia sp.]|nr:phosphatase PAP2 family protein [Pseudonocardia sp.]
MAALALLGPGAAGAATVLLKPLVGRTFMGDLAFPSGHTAGITAVSTVVAVMVVGLARSPLRTAAAVAVTGVLLSGMLMAFSLLSHGLHYPTDTVGGFATAVVVVLTIALLIDAVPRSRPRGAGAPARTADTMISP